MAINGNTFEIMESGWYEKGKKICEMKDDNIYKMFKR